MSKVASLKFVAVSVAASAIWLVANGRQSFAENEVPSEGAKPHAAAQPKDGEDAWVSQKAEFMAINEKMVKSNNPNMGRGTYDELQAQLAQPGLEPLKIAELRCSLSLEQLRFGMIDDATKTLDETISMIESDPRYANRVPLPYRLRGLAHLRKAEIENCLMRHNRECCIFPLKGGGIHTVSEPARLAKEEYLHYLHMIPSESAPNVISADYMTAAWLLNITCMALNEYPDGVPKDYLIPPSVFQSEYDIKRFKDVAPELGIDGLNRAGGAIVDDFDGDGFLDIVTSNCDPHGSMKAFKNMGDGTFKDVASEWKLDDQFGGLDIMAVDYNNDGRLDIFVPRGAWLFDDGCMRPSLLRNNSDGTFTDVTRKAGLGNSIAPTQAAVWADFDNDGWLDLYLGHESRVEYKNDGKSYPSQLFRNNGDGTFTDVTARAGVSNDRYAKGVAAGDYDNDGDMDIYVSNLGYNRLYRNNGDMTFTDVADKLGVAALPPRNFACWFFDYNNDGNLDIWDCAYSSRVADVALSAMHMANQGRPPCLYRNNGDGTFTNVTKEMGVDKAWLPMGSSFGDYDNDGWLDVYLGTGDPMYETLMPNVALRNDGGKRFQDVTQSGGFGHLQKGHGTVFADIDNDGDQDVFHVLGGFFPGDQFRNALFLNPGHGNHFVTIELIGVQTNRMAVGARISVHLTTPNGPRMIHRAVGSVASFGSTPRRQEIGLGDATAIESVEIWWPKSGIRQTITGMPLDSFVRVTEGQPQFEKLEQKQIKLKLADDDE